MRDGNYLQARFTEYVNGVHLNFDYLKYMPRMRECRIPQIKRQASFDVLDGIQQEEFAFSTFYQIGRDGCMLYGGTFPIYDLADVEELQKLDQEIGERVRRDWWYCGVCCDGYLMKPLALTEIRYLYTYRRSKWLKEKVLDKNAGWFRYHDESHKKRIQSLQENIY